LLNNSDSEKKEFDQTFESVDNQVSLNNDLDKALDAVQDESFSFLNLSSHFKNHSLVADKINELPNMSWKAGTYEQFKDKSILQLNKMAGSRRHRGGSKVKSVPSEVSDLPLGFNKWVEGG